MRRRRRINTPEAELDITSFMNLMIVLVPVLLLSLVFSQVRILNLQLPAATQAANNPKDEPKVLELIITQAGFDLNYPAGILLKKFDKTAQGYQFAKLSTYLQDLKLTFQQNKHDKSDIVLLLAPEIDYQTIVSTMDTVRSFKAVVAANLVDAELFPQISLGDAPEAITTESEVQSGMQAETNTGSKP
ncbi:biopolymer transporter ExbD [Colwellia psychrerythraea]|uniref:Biopolymer transport protein ExbD/TolR n=1 Tax=Colwellia psychrerythraea TaxID=28229 RepID=A0A099KXU9_COLPS|nr:biopolymer transporter ExbD [Colwellia psychrerythraea]KGJ95005.1 Biopolymer transport protein ExbD/TolR [Colwellia psychrerythraea]